MNHIFDWQREQIKDRTIRHGCPSISCWMKTSKNCDKCELKSLQVREIFDVINEAEAKWGCHAICYLDSPCEYQKEDISVTKVDDYYKEIRAKAIDEFAEKIKFMAENKWIYDLCENMDCEAFKADIEVIAEQLKESE